MFTITPERLYDPAQQLLRTLFLGEENFPTGPYADPTIISILRQIGLKGPSEVEPEDLLETALQIQDSIINAIRSELISPGSQLPSINEISDGLNIARKTAEKSYNELKRKNIIVSVPGKGYFVSENSKLDQKKVMLMFDIMNFQNKLSPNFGAF